MQSTLFKQAEITGGIAVINFSLMLCFYNFFVSLDFIGPLNTSSLVCEIPFPLTQDFERKKIVKKSSYISTLYLFLLDRTNDKKVITILILQRLVVLSNNFFKWVVETHYQNVHIFMCKKSNHHQREPCRTPYLMINAKLQYFCISWTKI